MFEKNLFLFAFFGFLFFLVSLLVYYFLFPQVKLLDCTGLVSFQAEPYLFYFIPLLSISVFSSLYLRFFSIFLSLSDFAKLLTLVVLLSFVILILPVSDLFIFFGIRKIVEIKTCSGPLLGLH